MGDRTKIEWTDATWSPVSGCSKVSPGCEHCYGERMARRFEKGWKPWTGRDSFHNVRFHLERLEQPLRWRKPRRVFVCSVSDLFHERVTDEFLNRVFAVMAVAPQHQFQLLTKRPNRMREYILNAGLRVERLVNDDQGRNSSINSQGWRTRNRRAGPNLADEETARPGRRPRRRVRDGGSRKSVPAGKGGVFAEAGLSTGHNDDQWEKDGNGGASARMGLFQRSNPEGVDHQSQERSEGRQSAGESRTGKLFRAKDARSQSTQGQAASTTRGQAPKDQTFGKSSPRDQALEGGRDDAQAHCHGIRDESKSDISNLLSPNMATHLIWPLPNVHLGVSCEDQQRADERIPLLLQTPAAIRFVSLEPLIGPVDLSRWTNETDRADSRLYEETPAGILEQKQRPERALRQVIVGGESGPGARPMHPGWARSVRDDCREAGVPFFFKQWREWIDEGQIGDPTSPQRHVNTGSMTFRNDRGNGDIQMIRVGKKQAGRFLDGQEWDEMPEVRR